MLQVPFIREHQELVINRLAKRNLDATEMIDEVIKLDEERRQTQSELDNTLAESNSLSKEIGMLYKSGNTDQANALKKRTTQLKDDSKALTEKLNTVSEKLDELLYKIPNVPNDLVPAGNSEDDNEEV